MYTHTHTHTHTLTHSLTHTHTHSLSGSLSQESGMRAILTYAQVSVETLHRRKRDLVRKQNRPKLIT